MAAAGQPDNENHLFGKFTLADGFASGRHVVLEIDEATGEISNYSLIGSLGLYEVVESLVIEDFEQPDIKVTGSVLKADSENVKLKVHDNPTGMISMHVGKEIANISFLLGNGFEVNSTTSWTVNGTTFTAILIGNETLRGVITCSNGTVTVEETEAGTYVNASLDRGMVKLRFMPIDTPFGNEIESTIMDGVAQNRVAGEVYVYIDGEEISYDVMEDDPGFQASVEGLSSTHLQLNLSSLNGKAAIVVIADTSGASWSEGIIEMNGVAMSEAASFCEIVCGDGTFEEPLYYPQGAPVAAIVGLLTADSSSHTFSILSPVGQSDLLLPLGMALELVVISLLVVAAVVLFRRR